MGRLDGKVALITGIGGGMGREAALRFSAEGARVVGCDMDAATAAETERLVREGGGTPEQLTDLIKVDKAKWGKIIKELGLTP